MAVQRFRTTQDARDALTRPRSGMLLDRIAAVWRRADRLTPGLALRGVHRFRSIDEAGAHRDAAVQDRVNRIRRSR